MEMFKTGEHDFSILQALVRNDWAISKMAQALGISRKNLWEKMRWYHIRPLNLSFRGFARSYANVRSADAASVAIDKHFAVFFMEWPRRQAIEQIKNRFARTT
jgi:hypothetical protein